jgi:hypothetical protein
MGAGFTPMRHYTMGTYLSQANGMPHTLPLRRGATTPCTGWSRFSFKQKPPA